MNVPIGNSKYRGLLDNPLGSRPDDFLSPVVQVHRAGIDSCIQEIVLCADGVVYGTTQQRVAANLRLIKQRASGHS